MTLKFIASMSAALVVTALAANTALAGGFVNRIKRAKPVIAPSQQVSDWAGAYVGGSLGYNFAGDDEVGLTELNAAGNEGESDSRLGAVDLTGGNLGLHAGYRWHRGDWVYGPELGIEGGSVNASDDLTLNGAPLGVEAESERKYLLGLRFKAGYTVSPNTLVYGTVGVGHGKYDYTLTDTVTGDSMTQGYTDTSFNAGIGLEQKLGERTSLFAQYEYQHAGKTDLDFELNGSGKRTRATPKSHNVKLGVNFRF